MFATQQLQRACHAHIFVYVLFINDLRFLMKISSCILHDPLILCGRYALPCLGAQKKQHVLG